MGISKKIRKRQVANSNTTTRKETVQLARDVLSLSQSLAAVSIKMETSETVETYHEYADLFIELLHTYEAYVGYVEDEAHYVDLGKVDYTAREDIFEVVNGFIEEMCTKSYQMIGNEEYAKDRVRMLKAIHMDEESFSFLYERMTPLTNELVELLGSINATNKTILTYFDETTNTLSEAGIAYVKKIEYLVNIEDFICHSEDLHEELKMQLAKLEGAYLPGEFGEVYKVAKRLCMSELEEQFRFNRHILDIVRVNI